MLVRISTLSSFIAAPGSASMKATTIVTRGGSKMLGQRARAPVSGVDRRVVERGVNDVRLHLGGHRGRTTGLKIRDHLWQRSSPPPIKYRTDWRTALGGF